MITSSVKLLNETKVKVTQLERALSKELASLPSAYGFVSLNSFVAAIKAAGGKSRTAQPRKATAPKPRKRATITDAIRIKVRTMVKAGKTGSAIAKALGISLPSVQNIKKALGLVKGSKKSTSKPKARRAPAKAAPKPKKKRSASKKAAVSAPKPSSAPADAIPVQQT